MALRGEFRLTLDSHARNSAGPETEPMPRRRMATPPTACGLRRAFTCGALILTLAALAGAGPPAVRVVPARAVLRGPDSVQQLSVEGAGEGRPAHDLTD